MAVKSVEYAQHHGHLAHAPMWQIIPKQSAGEEKRPAPPKIRYSGGKGENTYEVEIGMIDLLSYDDAVVFMSFLATAAPDQRRLLIGPEHELRRQLLNDDSPDGVHALGVESNFHEILIKLGWNRSATSYRRLEASMKRLSGVRMIYRFHREVWTSNLFGYRFREDDRRDFRATINPLSSAVILGDRRSGCVMPALHELREISGQTQLAAYFALVRLFKPGCEEEAISLESILRHVFRSSPSAKQRESMRTSLVQLGSILGKWEWKISVTGRGCLAKVRITRPKLMKLNQILP